MDDMSQARCKIQYLMVSVLLILVEDLLESCGYRTSRLRSGQTIEERRKDARKSSRRNNDLRNVVVGASIVRKGSLSRRYNYLYCVRLYAFGGEAKRITHGGVNHEPRIEGNGTSMRSNHRILWYVARSQYRRVTWNFLDRRTTLTGNTRHRLSIVNVSTRWILIASRGIQTVAASPQTRSLIQRPSSFSLLRNTFA